FDYPRTHARPAAGTVCAKSGQFGGETGATERGRLLRFLAGRPGELMGAIRGADTGRLRQYPRQTKGGGKRRIAATACHRRARRWRVAKLSHCPLSMLISRYEGTAARNDSEMACGESNAHSYQTLLTR